MWKGQCHECYITFRLCHDVCIKNVQLQFFMKNTRVESVRERRDQNSYLARIFFVVYSTNRYLSSFSVQFVFRTIFLISEFRRWTMRFITSGFYSIIIIGVPSPIISVIDKTSINHPSTDAIRSTLSFDVCWLSAIIYDLRATGPFDVWLSSDVSVSFLAHDG